MNILVKLPSRGRPDKLLKVISLYIEYATNNEKMSFLVSLDSDDKTVTDDLVNQLKSKHKNMQVCIGISKSKIHAVNRDMDNVSNYDILLLASDDMIPKIKGYDEIIRNKMMIHFPDTDGVLWFNDGYREKLLNTLVICGKKYYNRFNYIYHPDYKSFWCDNEFTDISVELKRVQYFPQVIIEHVHPINSTSVEMDETYIKNEAYDSQDRATYIRRKALRSASKSNFKTIVSGFRQ